MKQFEGLGKNEQVARLRALAEKSLRAYGIHTAELKLIVYGMNTVFQVTDAANGKKYALRIPPQTWLSYEAFVSEAALLLLLQKEAGIPVVRPVQGLDGAYVQGATLEEVPGQRNCMLFAWVEGRFFGDWDKLRGEDLFLMGRTLALFHSYGQAFSPPDSFKRPVLDVDGLFGPCGMYDPKERVSLFTASQRSVVNEALAAVTEKLDGLKRGGGETGLIHSDYYYRNLFKNAKNEIGMIDFDMCGHGFLLFDIVVPFWPFRQGNLKEAYERYLTGYKSVRALPRGFQEYRATFEAVRRLIDAYFYIQRGDSAVFRKMRHVMTPYAVGELEKYLRKNT